MVVYVACNATDYVFRVAWLWFSSFQCSFSVLLHMHAHTFSLQSKAVREVLRFEARDFSVFERINLLQTLYRPEKHNNILLQSQRRDAQTARHISGIQTVANTHTTMPISLHRLNSMKCFIKKYAVSLIKFTVLNTKCGLYNEHNSANQCLWFLQISLVDQRSLFSNFCLWGIQHECFIEGIQIHDSVRQKGKGTVKHPKTTHSPSSLDFLSQDSFGPFVSNVRWQ